MSDAACASLKALQAVVDRLAAPDGCPWDREQTPESLADYVIEESHELVAAIRSARPAAVCEELGDVLFLLLFIASLYEKRGMFNLAAALDSSAAKMIRRHPHVFSGADYPGIDEHLQRWEAIKKEEHRQAGEETGIFASLPESLPPLIKAYRIHSKAARAGFTWPEDEEVDQQVESEWLEWLDVAQGEDRKAQMHELGDMFFSLVEVGRRKGIKASEALDLANRRFIARFSRMEELAAKAGLDFAALSLDEKDELWNKAKAEESGADN